MLKVGINNDPLHETWHLDRAARCNEYARGRLPLRLICLRVVCAFVLPG